MKNSGPHRAALAQLDRRGGGIGRPILRVEDIDGYAHSLRDASSVEEVRKMNDSNPSKTGVLYGKGMERANSKPAEQAGLL